jgi:hypothetical protein
MGKDDRLEYLEDERKKDLEKVIRFRGPAKAAFPN